MIGLEKSSVSLIPSISDQEEDTSALGYLWWYGSCLCFLASSGYRSFICSSVHFSRSPGFNWLICGLCLTLYPLFCKWVAVSAVLLRVDVHMVSGLTAAGDPPCAMNDFLSCSRCLRRASVKRWAYESPSAVSPPSALYECSPSAHAPAYMVVRMGVQIRMYNYLPERNKCGVPWCVNSSNKTPFCLVNTRFYSYLQR